MRSNGSAMTPFFTRSTCTWPGTVAASHSSVEHASFFPSCQLFSAKVQPLSRRVRFMGAGTNTSLSDAWEAANVPTHGTRPPGNRLAPRLLRGARHRPHRRRLVLAERRSHAGFPGLYH